MTACNLVVIRQIFKFLQRKHIKFVGHPKLFENKIRLSTQKITQFKDSFKIDGNNRKRLL